MTASNLKALANNPTVTISDIRATFAALTVTKAEAYDLSREFGYTPHGSKVAVMSRLQSNVESMKMSMDRVATILR